MFGGAATVDWLRKGKRGGWRRWLLAWRLNQFRKRSTVFFTVQDAVHARRLRTTGTPWPTGDLRAHLGEGVYAWDNRDAARSYLNYLSGQGILNLEILRFRINNRVFRSLRQLDVDSLGDPDADRWLDRFSELHGGAADHGLQYIRRGTGFGVEHFFDKSVFGSLIFKKGSRHAQ